VLREIIIPDSEKYNLHIPKEYIHHAVEILVLPVNEDEDNKLGDRLNSPAREVISSSNMKNSDKKLMAISIDTKNLKFDREQAPRFKY